MLKSIGAISRTLSDWASSSLSCVWSTAKWRNCLGMELRLMQFSGHMWRAKDGQRLQLQSNLEPTGSSCILPTRLSLKPLACGQLIKSGVAHTLYVITWCSKSCETSTVCFLKGHHFICLMLFDVVWLRLDWRHAFFAALVKQLRQPSFIYGGEEFSATPPRVAGWYGEKVGCSVDWCKNRKHIVSTNSHLWCV